MDEPSIKRARMDHEHEGDAGTVPPPARVRDGANLVGEAAYRELYRRSLADPDGFWSEQAHKFLTWFRPFDSVRSGSFEEGDIAWFSGTWSGIRTLQRPARFPSYGTPTNGAGAGPSAESTPSGGALRRRDAERRRQWGHHGNL
jgi:hypothetical protein